MLYWPFHWVSLHYVSKFFLFTSNCSPGFENLLSIWQQDFLFHSIGMVSANPPLYQEGPDGLPWGGLCDTGMMQSPIDLMSSPATVHAPIQFRNFFNGHFNKVDRLCNIEWSIKIRIILNVEIWFINNTFTLYTYSISKDL